MNPQDAWSAAFHQLEMQLDRASFDTWVRGATLLLYEDGVFVIGVRNAYARDMLQHRLYRNVRRVLSDVCGENVELRFEVNKTTTPAENVETDMPLFRLLAQQEMDSSNNGGRLHERVARPQQPDLPETELNPRYTFDRFVVGNENQMVYSAACAVADHPAAAYNPLFIYGGVGLGKTHVMQAIAHACKGRGLRVIYIPSEAFTNDLVNSIRQRTTAMFREKYRSADVLLVDDIQFISGKETTQEEFFHTFNALYTFNKQIILASDRPPRELETLEARLRSRFEGGLVIDILPPEFETRVAILKSWAEERNIKIVPDVLHMIADRVKTNIRELEGVFNQMLAAIQSTRRNLTPDLAKDILNGYRRPRYNVSLAQVLQTVADHYGMSVEELVGPRRTGPLSQARQVAMYLAREITTTSLPQIGEAFGGRKHSTVIHSWNKIVEDMENDPVLYSIVQDIRTRLMKIRE